MAAKRKALVLGGFTGLAATAQANVLEEAGWEVTRMGRAELDFQASDAFGKLERLLDALEPDLLVNGVAYAQVDAAEDNADAADFLNRAVPAALGRMLKSRPSCTFVHYSSDFVFNGKKHSPYTTDDPTDPLNVYGKSKAAGEETLLSLGLDNCLVLRTARLFGPGRDNFVTTILNLCRKNGSVNVVHDQTGSPTYTEDLARCSLKLVEAEAHGLFHIVNAGESTWCELADEAARLARLECVIRPVTSAEFPRRAARPAYSVLDCSSFERVTGNKPRPWPQALRDYIYKNTTPGGDAPDEERDAGKA
ncbi:MAG: dTDP-4-dehydrorhamnose reductase [Desulfovibrio sp.]|jgi:dTDP-4-dehydrorhamnose reductase|nr:dTDP-4-dehydrorhamnose reductase [Desulfovibrio sp.]